MRAALLACLVACSSKSSEPAKSSAEPTPAAADTDEPGEDATRAVLDVFPHVLVMKPGPMGEYRDVAKLARDVDPDEVVAVEPFEYVTLRLQSSDRVLEVDVEGVGPARNRVRTDKERYVTQGVLPVAGTGAEVPLAIGDGVARLFGVRVGDTLTATRVLASWQHVTTDAPPATYIARVVGLVHTGISEFDDKIAFTTFTAAQTINNRGDQALGVALKLAHVKKAPAIAKRLAKALGGPPYEVQDWCQLNKAFLKC